LSDSLVQAIRGECSCQAAGVIEPHLIRSVHIELREGRTATDDGEGSRCPSRGNRDLRKEREMQSGGTGGASY
jgi:hypothetical protein